MATQQGATPQTQTPSTRSTTLSIARSKRGITKCLPEKVGSHSKRIDAALPGKHTRQLYDRLAWREASVLAQLRTGMERLNAYLYRIKVAATDQCACGQARETVEHSSSGAEGGQPNEQRCCDVRTQKEATFPSTLEESHRQMTKTGRRPWKQFEQRYGSQWPQVDSTQSKHGAEARHPHLTTPNPTLTNYLVTPTAGAASAAEDRMLNTWRIAFKLAY